MSIIFLRNKFYIGQLTEAVKGEFTKLVGQAFVNALGESMGYLKVMEERLRGFRLVKAILMKRLSSLSPGSRGKGKQNYFKKSLEELNRFEEELKRHLD